MSGGLYGRENLWSGQKPTARRQFTRNLSVSPKTYEFQLERSSRSETSDISRLDLCKKC